ncbi:class I SAM-dependent methyltransferase [Halobacteriovorax marinus]|uniref:class I SAM-dependent methyltransferase n=1 Tax=Halobacteriovorax marinus TaxID=97084 RepID=UPI0012FD749E|nr:class I SAM-dependent methyltransferase [Halobacteriovorax marinus]
MKIRDMLSLFFVGDNGSFRDRWIEGKLLELPDNLSILDAGCGEQKYKPFCRHLNYRSQDFGGYTPENATEGLHTEVWNYGKLDYIGDIWNIKEQSNTFDIVLCTEVLEHVPYPEKTLKELVRLLKTGGTLIFTAPFSSISHMSPYYFFSGFSKEFYHYHFEENGCEIKEIVQNGNAYVYLAQEFGRAINYIPNIVLKWTLKLPYHVFMVPLLKLLSRLYPEKSDHIPFGYQLIVKKNV